MAYRGESELEFYGLLSPDDPVSEPVEQEFDAEPDPDAEVHVVDPVKQKAFLDRTFVHLKALETMRILRQALTLDAADLSALGGESEE